MPFIQYRQIKLDDMFRMYYETVLIPRKVFRMGVQKALYQKSFELGVSVQSYDLSLPL